MTRLTLTHDGRLLQESLTTLVPDNCGYFNPWSIRRVTLYDSTWLVYIIDSPDRNIGVWHDSITLLILPDRNIRVQHIRYTSEYILKLQIHQHTLYITHNYTSYPLFVCLVLGTRSDSPGTCMSEHGTCCRDVSDMLCQHVYVRHMDMGHVAQN